MDNLQLFFNAFGFLTGLITIYDFFKKDFKMGIFFLVLTAAFFSSSGMLEVYQKKREDEKARNPTHVTDTAHHVIIMDTITTNRPTGETIGGITPAPAPGEGITKDDPEPDRPQQEQPKPTPTPTPCAGRNVGDVLFVNNSDNKAYVYYNTIEWQKVDYPVIVPPHETRKKQVVVTGGVYYYKVTAEPAGNTPQRPASLKNIAGQTGGQFEPNRCNETEVDVSL